MALLVASRPPVPPGQMTSTIYGHLREGRCNEAIQILEYELQVGRLLDLSLITELISIFSKVQWLRLVNLSYAFAELSYKQSSAVVASICTLSV
jgi:hypothetical protein